MYTLVPEDLISHKHLLHLATIQFAASGISHNTLAVSIHLLHQYICCILPQYSLLHLASRTIHLLHQYICCINTCTASIHLLHLTHRTFAAFCPSSRTIHLLLLAHRSAHLGCVALWCTVVHCGALWCTVVQCCSVVQCGVLQCSVWLYVFPVCFFLSFLGG